MKSFNFPKQFTDSKTKSRSFSTYIFIHFYSICSFIFGEFFTLKPFRSLIHIFGFDILVVFFFFLLLRGPVLCVHVFKLWLKLFLFFFLFRLSRWIRIRRFVGISFFCSSTVCAHIIPLFDLFISIICHYCRLGTIDYIICGRWLEEQYNVYPYWYCIAWPTNVYFIFFLFRFRHLIRSRCWSCVSFLQTTVAANHQYAMHVCLKILVIRCVYVTRYGFRDTFNVRKYFSCCCCYYIFFPLFSIVIVWLFFQNCLQHKIYLFCSPVYCMYWIQWQQLIIIVIFML